MKRIAIVVSLFALLIASGLASRVALANPGSILVYTGEDSLNDGYVNFGIAAGKPVDTQTALPADLSGFDCVVLPVNRSGFSAAATAALNGYVNGGGRILALGEFSGFAAGNAAMNGLATALGADLSIVSAPIDLEFSTTNNIDPSPFTAGVSSIRYAATSEVAVAVGPNAHSLVRSQGGTTFIGVDKIGSGVFVLSGDSNVFSDKSGGGYVNQDNGVLVANICDQASFVIQLLGIDIDIKPGSDPNCFNNDGNGVIPIAILGTAEFDVTQIDDPTVTLQGMAIKAVGKKGRLLSHKEDINGDGFDDLVVQIDDTVGIFSPADTASTLSGSLKPEFGGIPFEGTDSICITQ